MKYVFNICHILLCFNIVKNPAADELLISYRDKMMNQVKLRGAIIGYGFIASKGHMPAYLERTKNSNDVEIVAICDICPARKIDVPGKIRFYTDYQKILSKEVIEELKLDFVDIATHAADHYKIAKMALLSGLHVLCEKPLTTSIADAKDLVQTAFDCKRVLFPCHNYKHAPVINAIRELVNSGKIGKVRSVTLNTFRNTHAVGTEEWKPDWRRFKEYSGGGVAMDHGSHGLYLVFEWLKSFPLSVSASAQNLAFPKYDTEDNFSAFYQFENGHANIYLTWTAGVRKVIYTLQGEKGAITVDDDNIQLAIMTINENKLMSHKADWKFENYNIASNWMDSSHASWFNSMFDKFRSAIDNSDYFNSEIREAFFCIQAIMKAYESIENKSLTTTIDNSFKITQEGVKAEKNL
jgi:predicted dehydrogenase